MTSLPSRQFAGERQPRLSADEASGKGAGTAGVSSAEASARRAQPRKALEKMKPYSPGKPIWEVQKELGLDHVVKLASNENPLGPSPKALEAVHAQLSQLNRYPDAQSVHLREAIAAHLSLKAEQLVVTNGGDELITLLSETFLEPGDEIVTAAPTFSEYEFGASLMGAAVVAVPLSEGFAYNADALLAAVTERTKLVWLCSPNNPTGTYLTAEQLRVLLDGLPPHVIVILDAAYTHYVTADDYTDGLEYVRAGYPLVVLQTFSKIYGLAGIRVGFGAAPEWVIQQILQVKEPFNVNAPAQAAAAAAIGDKAHLEASQALNTAGREQFYAGFERLGIPYTPSMANFVLADFGPEAEAIGRKLLEAGVIVRQGKAWGLAHLVRVSVGTAEENEFFLTALTRILGK